MNDNVDQIAAECGLHGADIETLRDIVDGTADHDADILDIVKALYRRVEIANSIRYIPCPMCRGRGGFDSAEDSHECGWCNGKASVTAAELQAEAMRLIREQSDTYWRLSEGKRVLEARERDVAEMMTSVVKANAERDEAKLKMRETAKDFELAFRLVRKELDEVTAERDRLLSDIYATNWLIRGSETDDSPVAKWVELAIKDMDSLRNERADALRRNAELGHIAVRDHGGRGVETPVRRIAAFEDRGCVVSDMPPDYATRYWEQKARIEELLKERQQIRKAANKFICATLGYVDADRVVSTRNELQKLLTNPS